jgi:hypothetical protein
MICSGGAVARLCVWAALVAATHAQPPLPPTMPCGWRAVWNATVGEYAYRNVFTDGTRIEIPATTDGSALPQHTCPTANAIGTYGEYISPIIVIYHAIGARASVRAGGRRARS